MRSTGKQNRFSDSKQWDKSDKRYTEEELVRGPEIDLKQGKVDRKRALRKEVGPKVDGAGQGIYRSDQNIRKLNSIDRIR